MRLPRVWRRSTGSLGQANSNKGRVSLSISSAPYCRACVDNLHCLEKPIWGRQCSGNPQSAVESRTGAVERLARAVESRTWCSGKLNFTRLHMGGDLIVSIAHGDQIALAGSSPDRPR